jgi:hypothetical protein
MDTNNDISTGMNVRGKRMPSVRFRLPAPKKTRDLTG